MKDFRERFNAIRSIADDIPVNKLESEVDELVKDILRTDSSLLSVTKHFSSYGTYKSSGFANVYHFGSELADILVKALSGEITHNEDHDFQVEDFETFIFEAILEKL